MSRTSVARSLLSSRLATPSLSRVLTSSRPTLPPPLLPSRPLPARSLHLTPPRLATQSDGPDPRNLLPPGMDKLLDNPQVMASIEKLMRLLESKGVDVHSGKPPSMFQLAKIAADAEVRKVTAEVIRHAAMAHRATLACPSSAPRPSLALARPTSVPLPPSRRPFSTSSRTSDASSARPSSKALRKASFVRSQKDPSFVDALTLNAQAGSGGDGCVAFSRAKYVQYGPPSGGGGGKGGDVYVRAVKGLRSLARTPSRLEAGMGGHGLGDWKGGAKGRDKTINVPVGTIVQIGPAPDADSLDPTRALRVEYEEELLERFSKKFKRTRKRRRGASSASSRRDVAAAVTAGGVGVDVDLDVEAQPEEMETLEANDDAAMPIPSSQTSSPHPLEGEEKEIDIEATHEEASELDLEESEEALEEDTVEDDVEDAFDALLRRQRRDSVWRHYPGGGGGTGAPSIMGLSEAELRQESETDIAEQRREFEAAEERLAFALFKARRDESDEDRARRLGEVRILDLDEPTPNDSPGILVAKGGNGGYGNPFFLSAGAISRSPKMATRGEPGQAVEISLELKTPADIGLIGFPNAGKSTLLRAMTGAGRGSSSAKVGSYEFTTLSPNFGVVRIAKDGTLLGTGEGAILDSSSSSEERDGSGETGFVKAMQHASASAWKEPNGPGASSSSSSSSTDPSSSEEIYRFTLSDLPGLILGASENRGLGHTFLRHAERCRALFYVVDVGDGKRQPWEEVRILHDELEAYLPGLAGRVRGCVANKCDLLGAEEMEDGEDREIGSWTFASPTLTSGSTVDVASSTSSLSNTASTPSPAPLSAQERAKLKLRRLASEIDEMHGRAGAGKERLAFLPVSAMHRLGVERVANVMARSVREELEREREERERERGFKWD